MVQIAHILWFNLLTADWPFHMEKRGAIFFCENATYMTTWKPERWNFSQPIVLCYFMMPFRLKGHGWSSMYALCLWWYLLAKGVFRELSRCFQEPIISFLMTSGEIFLPGSDGWNIIAIVLRPWQGWKGVKKKKIPSCPVFATTTIVCKKEHHQ